MSNSQKSRRFILNTCIPAIHLEYLHLLTHSTRVTSCSRSTLEIKPSASIATKALVNLTRG